MANKYTNTASTASLVDPVTSSATSILVSGYTGWPGATPFWAEIAKGTASAEIVQVTAVSTNTLTVSRGQDGTAASAHNAGDKVEHVIPAYLPNLAESHAEATSAHGTNSKVVGATDTGTVTNKTYQGAHTHLFSDANPAGVTAGYKSTADTTALRDGFVHENASGDVNRAAFRATQVGADRFVVFNDGTAKITPSGTATRPGLENDGTTQLDGATTINGALTANGAETHNGTVTVNNEVTINTAVGRDALEVKDSTAAVRLRVDPNGTIDAYDANGVLRAKYGSQDNDKLSVVGANFNTTIDGTVKVSDPAQPSSLAQLWASFLNLTGTAGHKATIASNGGAGSLKITTAGPNVIFPKPVVASDPAGGENVAETWHNLTLLNGWSASDMVPGYKKTPIGTVILSGTATGGTGTSGTIVGNLPANYRPLNEISLPMPTNRGYSVVLNVKTNGDLQLSHVLSSNPGTITFIGEFPLDR